MPFYYSRSFKSSILAIFLSITAVLLQAAEPTILDTPQEQWVQAHRQIKVAPNPSFSPIDEVDANGRERGLAADYLKLIAARTGLEFQIVRINNFASALTALREHRVDMLTSALVASTPTAASGNDILYSAPYLRLPGAIFARQDDPAAPGALKDLASRKIAIVRGSAWQDTLRTQAANAVLYPYADTVTALAALAQGKVDAYVGDLVSTHAALERAKLGGRIELRGQLGIELPVSFAVRSDRPELKSILDTALNSVSINEERALRERWIKGLAETTKPGPQLATNTLVSYSDAINAARTTLTQSNDLSTEQRKQAQELLDAASTDETRADELLNQRKEQHKIADTAETTARQIEDTLKHDSTADLLAWRASLPERASVDELENLLAHERANLADARTATVTLKTAIDTQLMRPSEIRTALTEAHKRLEKIANTQTDSNPYALRQALHLRDLTAQRLALAEISQLEEEQRSYEPRLKLLSAQLRERERGANESAQRVHALESLVLERNRAAAAELNSNLAHERAALAGPLHIFNNVAESNIVLGQELASSVQRTTDLEQLRRDYADADTSTQQALSRTKERIDIGGVSEAVGLTLLAERHKLKSLPLLKRDLAQLDTELTRTRIRLIDLREQGQALEDLNAAVRQELTRLPEQPDADQDAFRQTLYRLLETRADILPRLLAAQTHLVATLTDTVQKLRSLTATTAELTELLDARLLWTPSHTPINGAWFAQLPQSFLELSKPRRWYDSLSLVKAQIAHNPLPGMVGLLIVTMLAWVRMRLPGQLEKIATPMRRIRTDSYRLTGKALLLSLLAAALLPFALWCLGQLWQHAAAPGYQFSDALGLGLMRLAPLAAALTFLRVLTLEKGLAHYHFRWTRPRRSTLARATVTLMWFFLPAQLFLSTILLAGDDAIGSSIGRLLFVVIMLGFGAVCWVALAPKKLWAMRDFTPAEPVRARQLLRVILAVFSLVLVVLAGSGYFLTALNLAERMLQSFGVLLVIIVLNALAVRWFVLSERRLALKRMEDKQREMETTDQLPAAGEEGRADLPESDEITLASVNAQTRRLLRALTWMAIVFAWAWVWSDVIPALSFLGNITAWNSTDLIDGKEVALHVTLTSLLLSSVALILTWVATRNLPGLLEVGVLRRLHVDAATRYAVVAVCRYAIVIIGLILGIGQLGVRWTHLQWLAAAFTVGLGFGLQEIFANFASGLIVLFERPFRVGDTVSVGTTEGTVLRIRTRATTLLDGDNKEIIVPNKTFITERLTNWTLSDTITRVVIKVGVAYSSDPIEVRRLLLDIAASEPSVLDTPSSTCWFKAFGTSTLEFELRVFVADIIERNRVRNTLNERIIQMFRERAIEIAFPQMDVWLHKPLHGHAP